MSGENVLNMIKENHVKFVDFRFTDTRGKAQHVSVPATSLMKTCLKKAKCLTVHQLRVGRVSMNLI